MAPSTPVAATSCTHRLRVAAMPILAWPSALGDDPAVSTIAHYKRENPTTHANGSLIAVGEGFTCYAIRSAPPPRAPRDARRARLRRVRARPLPPAAAQTA